jgi:hypothetical protein
VILVGAVAAAARASSSMSPETLYFRLLKSPVGPGLPVGYTAGTVGRGSLSKRAQRFHAVGEVDVIIDDGDAAIDFIVFPSRAAAVADWKDSKSDFHKNTDSQLTAPPDLPWPAIIGNSSLTGKDAYGKVITNGITSLSFTPKNVIVQTFTISSDHVGRGDVPATIRLARYALRHLRAIRP